MRTLRSIAQVIGRTSINRSSKACCARDSRAPMSIGLAFSCGLTGKSWARTAWRRRGYSRSDPYARARSGRSHQCPRSDAGIALATVRPGAVLINVSAITATAVSEGAAKPVSSITLNSNSFTPSKAVAQIVLSRELIDALTDQGVRALGRALVDAVAIGTDAGFISAISSTGTFEASSAPSADLPTIINDLEELLHLVRLSANSRP